MAYVTVLTVSFYQNKLPSRRSVLIALPCFNQSSIPKSHNIDDIENRSSILTVTKEKGKPVLHLPSHQTNPLISPFSKSTILNRINLFVLNPSRHNSFPDNIDDLGLNNIIYLFFILYPVSLDLDNMTDLFPSSTTPLSASLRRRTPAALLVTWGESSRSLTIN